MARRLETLLFAAATALIASCYADSDDSYKDTDRVSTPDPATGTDTGDGAVDGPAAPSDGGAAVTDCSAITDPIQQITCMLGIAGLGRDGGFTLPNAAQCQNPPDTATRILCGLTRRDAGAMPQDGGRPDPRIDAGPQDAAIDAQIATDASSGDGAVIEDASSDAGAPADASGGSDGASAN